jgi:SSS family solute:Na+ symporter
VLVARLVTLAASCVMVGGALWLHYARTTTLQHLWTEFQSIIVGGLLGLYLLGYLTTRGDGRAAAVGLLFAVAFSLLMSLVALEQLPPSWLRFINLRFDLYYTGIFGNALMVAAGYLAARLLPARPRDLTGLTIWTRTQTARSDE